MSFFKAVPNNNGHNNPSQRRITSVTFATGSIASAYFWGNVVFGKGNFRVVEFSLDSPWGEYRPDACALNSFDGKWDNYSLWNCAREEFISGVLHTIPKENLPFIHQYALSIKSPREYLNAKQVFLDGVFLEELIEQYVQELKAVFSVMSRSEARLNLLASIGVYPGKEDYGFWGLNDAQRGVVETYFQMFEQTIEEVIRESE